MNFIIYGFLTFFFMYHLNKYFYRSVLYLLGFRVDEQSLKNLPLRFIVISSHTTIYDFVIGMLFYYGYLHKDYNNYILMKKSYESIASPFIGLFDKKLKLIEVNSKKNGLIKKIIEEIQHKDNYIMYISPEGTRTYTENLKSGYWVISKELNLDVCYIGIDFYDKTIKIETPRKVEEQWDEEIIKFKESSLKYKPLFPENCYFYQKDKDM